MENIGAYEAKTKLPALLQKVLDGEYFIITKHGVPVAKLSPIGKHNKNEIKNSIEQLIEFRKGKKLGSVNLKDMIAEGRRI